MSDELGNHNGSCDCDVSAAHFREWLRDKYGHVDVVNRAWRTDYWNQHYSNFPEIGTPAASTGFGNPGQLLDWHRFCSDGLLEQYLAEKAVLREITPSIPVTTNSLVSTRQGEIGPGDCDYARWAAEQGVVSSDHYLIDLRTGVHATRLHLEFCADLSRGLPVGGHGS